MARGVALACAFAALAAGASAQNQPALAWVTQTGGTGHDDAAAIALAPDGSAYTAGYIQSDTPGDVSFGSTNANNVATVAGFAGQDGFLSKTDVNGVLQWVALLGGNGTDAGLAVAVAPDNNVLVGGTFSVYTQSQVGTFGLVGAASPATAVGYGQQDGFIAKSNPQGAFAWAQSIGGTFEDTVLAVTTDASGNIILGGQFGGGSNGPGLANASYAGVPVPALSGLGGYDGFVVSLTSAGVLNWAIQIGGTTDDMITDVATDSAGNIYASGSCSSVACFFGSNFAFNNQDTTGSTTDAFVVKLSPSGAVMWSFVVAGDAEDTATGVAVDTTSASGNVYMSGSFYSSSVSLGSAANAPELQALGSGSPSADAYIAALSPAGGLLWSQHLAGSGASEAMSLSTANGTLFASSAFTNGFAELSGLTLFESPESAKATMFIARMTSGGNITALSPVGSDYTSAVAVSADGSRAVIAGMMASSNSYPSALFGDVLGLGGATATVTTAGGYDGVLVSLSLPNATAATPLTAPPPPITFVPGPPGPSVSVPVPVPGAPVPVPGAPVPTPVPVPVPGDIVVDEESIRRGGLASVSGGGGIAGIVIGSTIFGLGAGVIVFKLMSGAAASSSAPAKGGEEAPQKGKDLEAPQEARSKQAPSGKLEFMEECSA